MTPAYLLDTVIGSELPTLHSAAELAAFEHIYPPYRGAKPPGTSEPSQRFPLWIASRRLK